jgi:hypothetical protein
MSGISKKLMGTTAAGGEALAIEDVFSLTCTLAHGSRRRSPTALTLMVKVAWFGLKSVMASYNHMLFDTERGPTKWIAQIPPMRKNWLTDY